jgi:hypothetical protein
MTESWSEPPARFVGLAERLILRDADVLQETLSGAATVEAAPARADLKAAAPGPRLDQRRSGEPDLECVPRMRRSVERSGKVLARRAA